MKKIALAVTDITRVMDESNCTNAAMLRQPVQEALDAHNVRGILPLDPGGDNYVPMHVSMKFINYKSIIRGANQVNFLI